jgi:hypothetical protein
VTETFVVGDTRRGWIIQIREDNVAVNISSWTAKLQGRSNDISKPIDLAGSISSAPEGKFLFPEVGNAISLAELGERDSALYTMQLRVVDGSAKVGYSRTFNMILERPRL